MVMVQCHNCGNGFEAKRSDAKWCSECFVLKRREWDRISSQRTKYDTCPLCGGRKYKKAKTCVSCRKQKSLFPRGEDNPSWKGGRSMHANGYVQILKPLGYEGGKHCYVLEHRFVWEKAYGSIPEGFILHHLNGDKKDNRLANLCALPRKAHNPKQILEPFRERIRELEKELSKLKE